MFLLDQELSSCYLEGKLVEYTKKKRNIPDLAVTINSIFTNIYKNKLSP